MRPIATAALLAALSCSPLCLAQTATLDPKFEWVKKVTTGTVPAGDSAIGIAECPAGKNPVAGGFLQSRNSAKFTLESSRPVNQMWRVNLRNASNLATPSELAVWVLCAKGVPVAPN